MSETDETRVSKNTPLTDEDLAKLAPEVEGEPIWTKKEDVVYFDEAGNVVQKEEAAYYIRYSDRSETLGVVTKDTVEKALTSRNIPETPSGLRALEDSFANAILGFWKRMATRIINAVHGGDRRRLDALYNTPIDPDVVTETMVITQDVVEAVWRAAIGEEDTEGKLPGARFDQRDQAAIEFTLARPDSILPIIQEKFQEARNVMLRAIANAFTGPLNLDALTVQLAGTAEGYKYEFERIARTEITRISNTARAFQWEKYADPNVKEYEWVVAHDDRTDQRCKDIAAGNPWTLPDLRRASNNFVPHPNCRCSVVRNPS